CERSSSFSPPADAVLGPASIASAGGIAMRIIHARGKVIEDCRGCVRVTGKGEGAGLDGPSPLKRSGLRQLALSSRGDRVQQGTTRGRSFSLNDFGTT